MTAPREQRERDAVQRRADAHELMSFPQFRRLAYWLLFQVAPVDGPTFTAAVDDPHGRLHAYNDGRRSVPMELGRLLREAHFGAFQQMEREANNQRKVKGSG